MNVTVRCGLPKVHSQEIKQLSTRSSPQKETEDVLEAAMFSEVST